MCLKKRFAILLKRSITLLSALSIAVCLGTYSVSALEPVETQRLLQDGETYTIVCVGPNGEKLTNTFTWYSAINGRIDYSTFFASPGGGYFYFLQIGVESGSLFTILPGQTVKISTLVTDFESDTFKNMYFDLVYSVNGQPKTITKTFSGTVLETEVFFSINNDSSSNYQVTSFSMYYDTPGSGYTGMNFGFRNPTVYMYDQSDKILAGFGNIFGESYDQPDDSKFDDYKQNEDKLNDSTNSYFDDYENRWFGLGNALGSNVLDFFGFMQFFNLLASIPIIDLILTFSICIGAFGLLLGVVSQLRRGS